MPPPHTGNFSSCPSNCTLPDAPVWRFQNTFDEDRCAWPRVTDYPRAVVGDFRTKGHACHPGWWCVRTRGPNHGFTSYDNILWAWLNIFNVRRPKPSHPLPPPPADALPPPSLLRACADDARLTRHCPFRPSPPLPTPPQCVTMTGWTSTMYMMQARLRSAAPETQREAPPASGQPRRVPPMGPPVPPPGRTLPALPPPPPPTSCPAGHRVAAQLDLLRPGGALRDVLRDQPRHRRPLRAVRRGAAGCWLPPTFLLLLFGRGARRVAWACASLSGVLG